MGIQATNSGGVVQITLSGDDAAVVERQGTQTCLSHLADLIGRYRESQRMSEQEQLYADFHALGPSDQAKIKQDIDTAKTPKQAPPAPPAPALNSPDVAAVPAKPTRAARRAK